ncbi:MAG: hypothetical protein P8M30_01800 [Planctomycetaceae bacterium]|jgi:hypothetical protein|nr:hypothetical protein [Planctomycetaceae bacterium]MDG2388029.1 hypothetical protein [Planctomycetaceae bacterium]
MRGLPGLLIAVGLGIVGAICNWYYLSRQASQMEKVAFVILNGDAQLNLGDRFRDDHLTKVELPSNNLGNLQEVGILWREKASIIGLAATKAYRGNEILLWQDLQTPSERDFSELLAVNEVARWVPVDSRSFIPERVSPGNLISFLFPRTSATPTPGNSNNPSLQTAGSTIIGPFRILSLGARTGDRDPRQAYTRSTGQENLIGISVKVTEGSLDPEAEKLFQILGNNTAPPGVILHSAELEDQPLR